MKKTTRNARSPVTALDGGEKTRKVVEKARRLTDAVRKLGVPAPKSEYRLAPPIGGGHDGVPRFKVL